MIYTRNKTLKINMKYYTITFKKIVQTSVLLLFIMYANDSFSQTKEKGPWWPHKLWGSEDMAGGSNWITPEKILEALALVEEGKVYEMGQVYESGMPLYGKRTYEMRSPGTPGGGPVGKNDLVYNKEILITEIGQVGTQFDGPGHVGTRVKFEDGTDNDVYYNGITGDEMYSPYGLKKLGVENVKPIITKGILIDIAGYKNVEVLDHSYEVTLEDVKGALKKQNINVETIKNGDALFFRYGWSKWWSQPEKYNTNPPGIGLEVAKWVVSMNACMVGSDQYSTEVEPNPNPDLLSPVHQVLLTENGIFNLENLQFNALVADKEYEFLFIFTPIPFKGATGSPGRPIAIK